MPFVLVRVRVTDYRRWKLVMDEHVAKRKELGSKGTRIFREEGHPDTVLCLTEWKTFTGAREFLGWGDPAEIGRRAGGVTPGEVTFFDEAAVLPA